MTNFWVDKKHNRFVQNKGFTLVELIVVLALMAIVIGITISASIGWIDWVRFQKENDTAEDIFYAAQNQLTELDSSGAMNRRVRDILWDSTETKSFWTNEELTKVDGSIKGNFNMDYVLAQGKKADELGIFNNLVNSDGENYSWSSVWLIDNNNPGNQDKDKKTIIKLVVGKNKYDDYISNPAGLTAAEKLLFDLVAPYISDKSVLNGCIALEFSPEAGQVFAVCYSDTASSFVYDNTASGSVKDISDRTLQIRKASNVGYYGVDSLTTKIRGKSKNSEDYRLEIDNGNVLSLILKPKEGSTETISNMDVTFTIKGAFKYNDKDNDPYSDIMSFTISKDQIDGLTANSLSAAASEPLTVTVNLNRGLYYDLGESSKSFRIPVWKDSAGALHIVLDAADVQAQSLTYAQTYGLLAVDPENPTASELTEINNARVAFGNTYSFYRFGFRDVRFIRAKVDISKNGGTGHGEAGRKPSGLDIFEPYSDENGKIHGEAVTFANYDDKDSDENDNIYGIKNSRHFYNIRFESDYSDAFKQAGKIESDRTRIYKLKSDLNWKDFVEGDNGNSFLNSFATSSSNSSTWGINLKIKKSEKDIKELYYIDSDNNVSYPDNYDTKTLPFPGFRVLSYSDSFTQKADLSKISSGESSDTYFKLQNFNISFGANCLYGVYGKSVQDYTDLSASSINYESISALGKSGDLPLGLFAESFGEITNIELDSINVSGVEGYPMGNNPTNFLFTSKVGGFVGENFGNISNLYIDEYKESANSGENENNNSNQTNNSEDLYKSHISGRSDVGGIVGHQFYIVKNSDPELDGIQTISGCINNAEVTGIGYVGGIIGRIYPFGSADRISVFDANYSDIKYFDHYIDVPMKRGEDSRFKLSYITKFTIDSCTNHGEIAMNKYFASYSIDTNTLKRGFYFGGIVGAAFADDGIFSKNSSYSDDESTKKAIIKECKSYTLYKEDKLKDILKPGADQDKLNEEIRRTRANFVGGIVGGARYAYLYNCSTTPVNSEDNKGKYSFVFGNRYVGGVAGYLVETKISSDGASYTQNELSKLSGDSSLYRSEYSIINGTGAFGNHAVGGIAGAFGKPEQTSVDIIINGKKEVYKEYVGEELEKLYSNDFHFPMHCGQLNNSNCKVTGLLNTAIVLGNSFNSNLSNALSDEIEKNSFYGIGGVVGLDTIAINNADCILDEDTKELKLGLLGFSVQNDISSLLDKMSVSDLQSYIDASDFCTDGVGGIVGQTFETGRINKSEVISGNTITYNSKIDTIVFGRNRVGGAVGDTTASRGNNSRIANFYPVKGTGSSGMYVLGKDCVGGIIGVYGEKEDGKFSGFNISADYDNGVISTPYHVIGYRGVGGIVGVQNDYISKKAERKTLIKVLLSGSDKISVKGSMYVGGLFGLHEGYTDKSVYKYHIEANNIDVEADCFAGCIVGAMYSKKDYWQVDRLADNDSVLKSLSVNAKLCAGFVTGLYAPNANNKSVLVYNNDWKYDASKNNYFPVKKNNKYESKFGIYNVASLKDFEYNVINNDYLSFIADIQTKFASSASAITIDMNKFTGNDLDASVAADKDTAVQRGGKFKSTVIAQLYVGGLFGYVPDNTPVTVVGYRNRAQLQTKDAVESCEAGDDDTTKYSYLGGVSGKIPRKMILKYCRNTSGSNDKSYISDKATYLGAIAEVNAGMISNCNMDDKDNILFFFSDVNMAYTNKTGVGGIVGVNGTKNTDGKTTGVITDSYNLASFDGNKHGIQGKTAAGIALAAGGSSTISGCINLGDIQGSSGAAGIMYKVLACVPDSKTIIIKKCVNAGLVTGNNDSCAGIAYNTRGMGEIEFCRNYTPKLNFAITSSKDDCKAKTIKYCIDAGNTTEESEDIYSGFGLAVSDDVDKPYKNMVANLYIKNYVPGSESTIGTPSSTSSFVANKFYSENITRESSGEENNNDPVKGFDEVDDSIEDIDKAVLNSDINDNSKKTSSWSLHPETGENSEKQYLSFEVQASDASGVTGNSFADINKFIIYWNNSAKTEIKRYYSYADDLKSDDKEDNEYYRSFVGLDDSDHIYQSFRDIARDVCKNNTAKPEEVADDWFETNTTYSNDNDGYDIYGKKVYLYMKAETEDYDKKSSSERKQIYIGLLYQMIGEDLSEYDADSVGVKEFTAPLDSTYLDAAVSVLNEGLESDESQHSNLMYVAENANYSDQDNYSINRNSFIKYSGDEYKSVYDYIYSTYVYMMKECADDVPYDSDEKIDYYKNLLSVNSLIYGVKNSSSPSLNISYNVYIKDINNNTLSLKTRNCEFTEDYKADTINIESLKGASDAYKEGEFDYDKIARIVVILNGESQYDGKINIGIKALYWKNSEGEEGDPTQMSSSDTTNPFERATNIREIVIALDDNNIPLQHLYFNDNSPNKPDIYLYKYSTGIKQININDGISEGNQIQLLDTDNPQYFSSEYINNTTVFNKQNYDKMVKGQLSIPRYLFYKKVDSGFKKLMKPVYSTE